MNKIDSIPTPLTSSPVSLSGLEAVHRLIVLISPDIDYHAVTHRLWELANTTGMSIQFLSLFKDAAQEPGLRRGLATLVALVQDGRVSAESKVEFGTNWVDFVKRNYQTGDMIVCFAEQRAGLLHRPLSQILRSNLNGTVYILSGLYPQNLSRSNWLSQLIAWLGSFGIIAGAAILQIRIISMPQDWGQTTLMILSVMVELWLIGVWNGLFS